MFEFLEFVSKSWYLCAPHKDKKSNLEINQVNMTNYFLDLLFVCFESAHVFAQIRFFCLEWFPAECDRLLIAFERETPAKLDSHSPLALTAQSASKRASNSKLQAAADDDDNQIARCVRPLLHTLTQSLSPIHKRERERESKLKPRKANGIFLSSSGSPSSLSIFSSYLHSPPRWPARSDSSSRALSA